MKLIEAILNAPMPLEERLSWHLASVIAPAVPQSMVDPCALAIRTINAGLDPSTQIALPADVLWQGNHWATAREIIDGHYLHIYIGEPDRDPFAS